MIGKYYLKRVGGYDPPNPQPVSRSALGPHMACLKCPVEFYVYRSDIHHASQELPVTHCPYCGSPVEVA